MGESCGIDSTNSNGDSLLYCACLSDKLPNEKAKLLLEYGASIENYNHGTGRSSHPLIILGTCPYETFRFLLSHISLRAYAKKFTDWEHWMYEYRIFALCHRKYQNRIKSSFILRFNQRKKKKETVLEAFISVLKLRAERFTNVQMAIALDDDISQTVVEFIFGVQSTIVPTEKILREGWRKLMTRNRPKS